MQQHQQACACPLSSRVLGIHGFIYVLLKTLSTLAHQAPHPLCLQKRQQQAKQAPHQTRLSVLATHTRLKHHLSLSPPAAPVRPSFHVGKKGKNPPVTLQVRLIHASIHAAPVLP